MKIAIVQFPGSNCERETMLAVQRAGMTAVEFLWNESAEKLRDMDGYVIVGGFSYEDRSRAGIIAALDPVMREIKAQSDLGKPVLGICNGAQILVETGLVPGLEQNQLGMVLTDNKRIMDGKILGTGFYNAWIHMRVCDKPAKNAFTRHLTSKNIMTVPVAHAEGRFVMSEELLKEVQTQGLNVFQYCDEAGNINNNFPVNPNGSMLNIAAICNKAGNVMAMMPHPERTTIGDPIFTSMKEYIEDKQAFIPSYLSYKPSLTKPKLYTRNADQDELLVELIITDNYALTVQNTLQQLGIPVKVRRMVHWTVANSSPALLEKVIKSGVLFNERKEYLVKEKKNNKDNSVAYLIRATDNLLGQQKQQMLEDHFAVQGITSIHHGIVWIFTSEQNKINDLIPAIMKSNIIFNPYAHECYEYEYTKSTNA